jgi:hypothetical protein
MSFTDRGPLANSPTTHQIMQSANNRLGAIYSALYSFWSARHAAVTSSQQVVGARRDAYSIVLFNESATNILANDFRSSPGELLDLMLPLRASGGTDFSEALQTGKEAMMRHWSTERFVRCLVLHCEHTM